MPDIRSQLHQLIYTWLAFPRASQFIREHRLWAGLKQYKWVYRGLLVLAIFAGWYLLDNYFEYIDDHADAGIVNALFTSEGFLFRIGSETMESLQEGSLKWIALILLEVIIYHFMRQSLKIIANKDSRDAHKFKPFADAQIRMITVSFMAYGLEIAILNVAGSTIFSWFSWFGIIEPAFAVLVQSSLLGFAIVDNYNEQFGLEISQSFRYSRMGYLGVCAGVGIPLFYLLKVPFIGIIVGPIIASIVVALVMHELSDLATVGYIPSEKEQKKMDKKAAKAARKAEKYK